ncbi:hypothetical protein Hanom_Chr14g01256861 [Helianthus anomalus]
MVTVTPSFTPYVASFGWSRARRIQHIYPSHKMRWVYISEEVERTVTSFTVFILSLFFIRSSNLQATCSRSSSFLFISSSFSLRYSKFY